MLEEEVLACAFGEWYERFRSVTFKSEVISLPEDFVKYLLADGIKVKADDDCASESSWGSAANDKQDRDGASSSSSSSDGDDVTEADFPELEEQISASISRLGGAVLPKLNWSAPKDATWLQPRLKCISAKEVITILKASDFIAHDLCHSFDHCGVSRTRPDSFTLVLRKWRDLYTCNEFRCFVSDGELFAISQRDTSNYYEHLGEQGESEALRREICCFFEEHLQGVFPLRRYAFDVYIGAAPQRKTRLVDFSPWGPTTDPCLFDWPELNERASARRQQQGSSSDEEPPEFRVVREEAERQAKAERYSQLPLELAQLSAGEGLEDLIRKADRLLEQKGQGSG